MMSIVVQTENDLLLVVSAIRYLTKDMSFGESHLQSIIVSAMELTRNVLVHGGGKGLFQCETENGDVHLTVSDQGPGIADIDAILSGQFHSEKGLGLGLSGVTRLMDELRIETSKGGTTIRASKRRI